MILNDEQVKLQILEMESMEESVEINIIKLQ